MGLNLREKERLAENKFKEWLNEKEIPFWYIHQEPDTFSNVFRKENVKRPDFIILIPNIGFILTDVEYKCRRNIKILQNTGKIQIKYLVCIFKCNKSF